MSDLPAKIMSLRPEKTLSHFIKVSEHEAYVLGFRQAKVAAAEIAAQEASQ